MPKITIELSETVYSLLEVLTNGEWAPAKTVPGIIDTLIDHAQQGCIGLAHGRGNGWSRYSRKVGRNILSLAIPTAGQTGRCFGDQKEIAA
jgi:hypothetical protein